METIKIHINGMTCGGCVKSATHALEAVEGVQSVQVDLTSASAQVQFNPAKTNAAALLEAVEDAGYDASL